MTKYSGKFIVIDGTDGSGKTTQLNLLQKRLENEGYQVEIADFPQYNTKSAGLIEEYLSGKYGDADAVGPYKASIFYAADRYDASFKIKKWLQGGKMVLSNRYTSSNMGHQGGKINNSLERKLFFDWLYKLEYELFEIPRPDISIILHVDSIVSQQLAKERNREDWHGKINDIHENDLSHLQKAEKTYKEISSSFPGFTLIECSPNSLLMSREEIHQQVWRKIREVISKQKEDTNLEFRAIADIIQNKQPEISIPTIKINDHNNKLLIEKIHTQSTLPRKAHDKDAGYDLYSVDYHSIPPYSRTIIPIGIKIAIPDKHVGLIWDKSGLAKDGLTTLGGVIDSNYRGEIKVIVQNLSEEMINIIPKQKIAQLIIQPLVEFDTKECIINDITERQNNGFGSSGKL